MRENNAVTDAAEIERFEKLADDWWNPRGPMRALHRMNPARVEWIRARIVSHFALDASGSNVSILDIGCGGGLLSEALARMGARVTGVDPSPRIVAAAQAHAASNGLAIAYRAATADTLGAEGITFDVVCALEVVEHSTDAALFVAQAARLVRPGGLLLLSTLNRTFRSFALAIVGAEYVLRWAPVGTHQWEKFITPQELEEMIEHAGLEPCARTGLVFDPLRAEWRISRDMAINYMMAAERPAKIAS